MTTQTLDTGWRIIRQIDGYSNDELVTSFWWVQEHELYHVITDSGKQTYFTKEMAGKDFINVVMDFHKVPGNTTKLAL
jgi:hypothetical protein